MILKFQIVWLFWTHRDLQWLKFYKPVTRRIDYIFINEGNVGVLKYAVLSDSKDCRYSSDHLPVYIKN